MLRIISTVIKIGAEFYVELSPNQSSLKKIYPLVFSVTLALSGLERRMLPSTT